MSPPHTHRHSEYAARATAACHWNRPACRATHTSRRPSPAHTMRPGYRHSHPYTAQTQPRRNRYRHGPKPPRAPPSTPSQCSPQSESAARAAKPNAPPHTRPWSRAPDTSRSAYSSCTHRPHPLQADCPAHTPRHPNALHWYRPHRRRSTAQPSRLQPYWTADPRTPRPQGRVQPWRPHCDNAPQKSTASSRPRSSRPCWPCRPRHRSARPS